MNASSMFDMFLTLFFLMTAVVILGAAGMALDNLLDPHCNCAEIRRQERDNQGVTL